MIKKEASGAGNKESRTIKAIKYRKPPFLTAKAVKYWNILLGLLQDVRGFHEIDTLQLGILCNSLADYQEATKVLEREGRFYVSSGGM